MLWAIKYNKRNKNQSHQQGGEKSYRFIYKYRYICTSDKNTSTVCCVSAEETFTSCRSLL